MAEDMTVEEKHRHLEKLVNNNITIENDLIKRKGVQVQPWAIVNLRIDMLLNAILEEDERLDFEIESAKRVHDILMHVDRTAPDKNGLVLPGKAPLQLP